MNGELPASVSRSRENMTWRNDSWSLRQSSLTYLKNCRTQEPGIILLDSYCARAPHPTVITVRPSTRVSRRLHPQNEGLPEGTSRNVAMVSPDRAEKVVGQ